jgi:hypothetical protein
VPELTIPKEYERGITVIKSLSDSDVGRILDVLKDKGPGAEPTDIVSEIRPTLPQLSDNDLKEFVDTLYSLYFLRASADVTVDQFVNDLAGAIRESSNKDIQTSDPQELGHLRSKFRSLLTVRPLSLQSKANELQRDFANIFWNAKIFTDIRPVWDSDVKKPPAGTVITNTLKLEYHHTGGHGELYLYVNKDNIDTLLAVLKRAKNKMATLESLATAKWMKTLGQ